MSEARKSGTITIWLLEPVDGQANIALSDGAVLDGDDGPEVRYHLGTFPEDMTGRRFQSSTIPEILVALKEHSGARLAAMTASRDQFKGLAYANRPAAEREREAAERRMDESRRRDDARHVAVAKLNTDDLMALGLDCFGAATDE